MLYADVEGKGHAVLFLHGQFGTSRIVRPLVGSLSERLVVITPDLRGRGRSVCRDIEEHEWDRYVDDVVAVLDVLGFDRAVVGGVSFGAGVALAAGLRHPERISALVLYSSPYAGGAIGWREGQRKLQSGVLEAAKTVFDQEAQAASEILKSPKWARHDPKSLCAALLGLGFAQPFGNLDDLDALKMPCMIVPGSGDMHPREVSLLYSERIKATVWSEAGATDFPAALREFLTGRVIGSV